MMATRLLKFLFIFAVSAIASGCAHSHFSTPDAWTRVETVKTIGIVSPDISVYQISPDGGIKLERLSEAASRDSVEAMMDFFKDTGYRVTVIGPDFKTRKELLEVQALSKAVHKNLREFWDIGSLHPPTLGSLDNLADFYNVEAFLFMDAIEVHKEEKISLSKSLVTLAVSTVYGTSALPKQGRSIASISLAERSGTVIWASSRDTEIDLDRNFRQKEGTRKLVGGLLSQFPR